MANLNLNEVILCGRLTAAPELKTTPSGISVCSLTLAVNRKYSKEGEQTADFINCVAWRERAEFIAKYFKKGSSLCIIGAIQTRNFTDKDGVKRYVTEVLIDDARFVDSKTDGSQTAPGTADTAEEFEVIDDDLGLPF